jgi:DNA processing protein
MKYLNALNLISGIGPKKTEKLLDFFKSSESTWNASADDLNRSGIGEKLAEKIVLARKNISPSEELEKLQKENIKIVSMKDFSYPALLRECPSAPYIIYTKGNMDLNASPAIAIVGSRKNTPYGAQVTKTLAKKLAEAGITIVSGMALGTDSFAHTGALEGMGKTIAVLGNSLDDECIYPRTNFNLSRNIVQNGVLVSEYPMSTPASHLTFPARNRIIAGLTLGTIVIEAREKSGALITAEYALDFNREVFSVPGSIFSPESAGTNNLIKKGAKVVTSIKDILEELNLETNVSASLLSNKNPGNENEKMLLKILSSSPLHIDNIARISKLNTTVVSATLSMMEIKGWTKNIGGQNYIIT